VLFVGAPIDAIARELHLDAAVVEARLASARDKLLAARDQRPRPLLDTRILVADNAALCRALIACGESALARDTLDRLYAEAPTADASVRHRLGADGIAWLDDHAELALAALDDGRPELAARFAPPPGLPGSLDGQARAAELHRRLGDPASALAIVDANLAPAIAQGPAGSAIVALALEVKKLHLTF
jgi:hypothetical protein